MLCWNWYYIGICSQTKTFYVFISRLLVFGLIYVNRIAACGIFMHQKREKTHTHQSNLIHVNWLLFVCLLFCSLFFSLFFISYMNPVRSCFQLDSCDSIKMRNNRLLISVVCFVSTMIIAPLTFLILCKCFHIIDANWLLDDRFNIHFVKAVLAAAAAIYDANEWGFSK